MQKRQISCLKGKRSVANKAARKERLLTEKKLSMRFNFLFPTIAFFDMIVKKSIL